MHAIEVRDDHFKQAAESPRNLDLRNRPMNPPTVFESSLKLSCFRVCLLIDASMPPGLTRRFL
jgi:hypothetical protein